jgi:Flp pilus assembly CpaF family ATPase
MRPDRILLGELRGSEAFAFLRAVNTGHPGSITTVRADTAARSTRLPCRACSTARTSGWMPRKRTSGKWSIS